MVEQHQKYKLSHQSVQDLLSDIDNKELVIPEIQRPFVWDSSKIRDFIDSLYRGYPVGFLISWKDPKTKVKLRNHQTIHREYKHRSVHTAEI